MNNNEELSDEEKSFNEWLKNTTVHRIDMPILRKAYLNGFVAGWQYRQDHQAKEWLQK